MERIETVGEQLKEMDNKLAGNPNIVIFVIVIQI